MTLVIDNREKALITKLREKQIDFEIKQLDIGDIQFLNSVGEIALIFERKTINDLSSSILDGRYKEQGFRLDKHPLHNHNIFYIIEGNICYFNSKSKKITSDTLYSSLCSICYQKGFSLIRSNHVDETLTFLLIFFNKFKTKKEFKSYYLEQSKDTNTKQETDYIETIKLTKQNLVTKENIETIMLMQIPKVSATMAKIVIEKYKTIYQLIDCLRKDKTCLDSLTYTTKQNKERRFNKPAIKNIIDFLSI
jgi:ERCC4-type nuclease